MVERGIMSDRVSKLKDLAELLEKGLISREEFEREKQLVLNTADEGENTIDEGGWEEEGTDPLVSQPVAATDDNAAEAKESLRDTLLAERKLPGAPFILGGLLLFVGWGVYGMFWGPDPSGELIKPAVKKVKKVKKAKVSKYDASNIRPMKWVRIEPGTFTMGRPESERLVKNEDQHEVEITRPFWIADTELTMGHYFQLTGTKPPVRSKKCDANCALASMDWENTLRLANLLSSISGLEQCYIMDDNGQIDLTATPHGPYDSEGFLKCRGYRLPTEAEWEYAATERGTLASAEVLNGESAWFSENSAGRLRSVAMKSPNSLGLYDMAGNVSEWVWEGVNRRKRGFGICAHGARNRRKSEWVDPIFEGHYLKFEAVVKGGSFSHELSGVHPAAREALPIGRIFENVGVRFVRTIYEDSKPMPANLLAEHREFSDLSPEQQIERMIQDATGEN